MSTNKIQLGPNDILFPVPAALIVSGTKNVYNIITIAWIGIMGSKPPIIAISLEETRYSLNFIRKSKEFTVNIPSANYFVETDYCGIISGKKRDKFRDTKFTPLKSNKVNPPIIKECPFNIECKVIKEIDLGYKWIVYLVKLLKLILIMIK